MNLHRGYLARIKHKCLITILSLLELSDIRHGIATRVKRTIPIHIIVENIVNLYEKYRNINQDKYSMQSFEYLNYKIAKDAAPKDSDEAIIQLGFNLFILLNVLLMDQGKQKFDAE
jgi:hypothetical protein